MEITTVNTDQMIAQQRMEIDSQVATAKQYPRDLQKFQSNSEQMICYSPEAAAECNYSLTKGNSIIEGPSIRLAEIMLANWGNLRTAARVLGHDGKKVTVQAVCHDLENNVKVDVEVSRSILTKKGTTYSSDMINVTTSAAISIGLRNALFKVIPAMYTKRLSEIAKQAARGTSDQFTQRKQKAIEHFIRLGVSEDRIKDKLEIKNWEEFEVRHLDLLLGLATGIQQGQTTIENEFPTKIIEPQPQNDNE